MNPYFLDLRQKIVKAYENREGSLRQLAKSVLLPNCGYIPMIQIPSSELEKLSHA